VDYLKNIVLKNIVRKLGPKATAGIGAAVLVVAGGVVATAATGSPNPLRWAQVASETPEPTATPETTIAPVPAEIQAPAETETPAPAETETPAPAETETPAPAETEAPQPPSTESEQTGEHDSQDGGQEGGD